YPLLVRKVLKSLWFVTSHTNQIRRYRLKSFGRSATEHKFVKNEGEQTTVADYFNDKWNIRLRHPHLPVVELFNPAIKNQSCFLPMELVTVDEWQRSLKPLTTDQQAKVTKKTVVRPGERYGMIRRVADERGFNNDSYLSKFGITVDVNEMVMLRARILPPPEIKYKSAHGDQREVVERVQIGKWWLNNRFNKAREIRAWAVILVSQREPDNRQIRLARDFASKIPQAMSKYGIRFNSSPIEKSDAAVPQTILARMNELKMHGCEVIIYILNQVGDDIYHAIKFFGNELPIHHILINKDYFDKIEKQLSNPASQVTSIPPPVTPSPQPSSSTTTITPITEPQFRLSDFKPSTFQSLSSMLKINSNISLFRIHPHLKTHTYSPIEQAINESFQTVQRSLKVATTAAETIARKDFLLNPDEQQLRTSARNMVAYLSSGLVLITARSALQEQIQSYIKTHFCTVLGISQTSTMNNNNEQTTTIEMIQQAANEIATSNIELCCCLLQRITISRAIQLIDQRLLSDIELRQRCRAEGRQLPMTNNISEERLPEQIRLHHGPFSPHQLAIYEDFVHFIPGFKPNDSEKRDLTTMDESVPSVWDRLISDIDQTIQSQRNQLFTTALQRLLESVNLLRSNLQSQTSTNAPQAALTNLLNMILYNYLEHYTMQSQIQDNESFERFKTIHMNVLKLLIEIRLPLAFINKQLTKAWLECVNEFKFNIFAVHHLIRNRLLDIRQIDVQMSQLIDSGSNSALHFAVNFLRSCVIEQPCCSDNDIPLILDSLHRISLIGKQPAEAVRDLLEIIRLNYTSLTDSNENKIDKLAILSLSVINNGMKYLSIDDIETVTIVNKAKIILNDWITLTMKQTNRISQQQAFQEYFNQMTLQGIFRSDDTIAKFLRTTIQLCINNVYDVVQQNSSSTQQQHPQYVLCHQGIDSLCRFLYLLTVHTSDNNNYGARIHLINCILGLLATLCFLDHEERGDQFHPLAYQRIILNLFQESTNAVTLNVTK
ncbi:unnamed protein product, partial [Rotaria sp. Silwood2]